MSLLAKELFKLCIIGVCCVPIFANAQENLPPVDASKDKGEVDQGINTGYVVVYGKLLKPPYYVRFENDTIWINDVFVYPKVRDPNPLPPKTPWYRLDDQERELVTSIRDTYENYREDYGEHQAYDMIVTEFQTNPLLSSMTTVEGSRSLILNFKKGVEFSVNFVLTKLESRPMVSMPGPPISKETWRESWERDTEHYRTGLRRGEMLIFAYTNRSGLDSKGAERVRNLVEKIKRGVYTQEEGIEELNKIFVSPRTSQTIIENIESW